MIGIAGSCENLWVCNARCVKFSRADLHAHVKEGNRVLRHIRCEAHGDRGYRWSIGLVGASDREYRWPISLGGYYEVPDRADVEVGTVSCQENVAWTAADDGVLESKTFCDDVRVMAMFLESQVVDELE